VSGDRRSVFVAGRVRRRSLYDLTSPNAIANVSRQSSPSHSPQPHFRYFAPVSRQHAPGRDNDILEPWRLPIFSALANANTSRTRLPIFLGSRERRYHPNATADFSPAIPSRTRPLISRQSPRPILAAQPPILPNSASDISRRPITDLPNATFNISRRSRSPVAPVRDIQYFSPPRSPSTFAARHVPAESLAVDFRERSLAAVAFHGRLLPSTVGTVVLPAGHAPIGHSAGGSSSTFAPVDRRRIACRSLARRHLSPGVRRAIAGHAVFNRPDYRVAGASWIFDSVRATVDP
jgi:hypothetical protein